MTTSALDSRLPNGLPPDVEWRSVPDWDGYLAGSDGTIWSYGTSPNRANRRLKHFYVQGYPSVRLAGPGRSRSYRVHQLIAWAFHGPCPAGQNVRHLDGDCKNPRPDNLAYGTWADQEADKVRHGTSNSCKTVCVKGHPFTETNTIVSKSGNRGCRQCALDHKRRLRAEVKMLRNAAFMGWPDRPDRAVYAQRPDGSQIVRYSSSARWFLENAPTQGSFERTQLTVTEAARMSSGEGWAINAGLRGGRNFYVRARRAAQAGGSS